MISFFLAKQTIDRIFQLSQKSTENHAIVAIDLDSTYQRQRPIHQIRQV